MAISTDFLHQLDRFSLIIRKRVTSNYTGERQTRYTGRGLIFKDHSIYTPGADFRNIDWRVFARTDKLYIKRFEEERNLTVHVIIDYSASMKFGDKMSKADYAAMIGLGYSYLAMKNNERFVVSTFSDKLELFKPKKGRSNLAAIYGFLTKKRPGGVTNFEQSLSSYKRLIDSKSYIVIISDFFYDIDQIKRTLYRMRHHTIHLVQVLDKVERNMNLEGDYKLRDLETGGILRTFISPLFKKNYFSQLAEHNAAIKKACDEVNAHFHTVDSGQNIFDAFYGIVGKNNAG